MWYVRSARGLGTLLFKSHPSLRRKQLEISGLLQGRRWVTLGGSHCNPTLSPLPRQDGKVEEKAGGSCLRKGTPLASRVAQGVSGPSSSCVWNPRVFLDDGPSGDVHVENLLLCCWKRVFAMTSAFSWQNSFSLCHQAPPSLGFSRQEHWSGLPFPSPMHESEK